MMKSIRTVVLVLGLLGIGAQAQAEYMLPQLLEVPIERVEANLGQQLARVKRTGDPQQILAVQYNLARIQAMRYADQKRKVQVLKDGYPQNISLYEGWEYPGAAPGILPPGKRSAGLDSLHRAIDTYRQILEARPDDKLAQLGLGWCLQQDGKLAEAQTIYTRLIDNGLKLAARLPGSLDKAPPSGLDDFDFRVAFEARMYQADLYRQTNNQSALQKLQQQQSPKLERALEHMTRYMLITPIAIPLRDGVTPAQMINRQARVRFDLDGRGPKCWHWLSDEAAWLVYRQPGVNTVTSGRQLFGAITFSLFWENGYQALATLDDNGDGQLSGGELRGLALWRDRNRNGVAEADEIKPLGEYGITALSLIHQKISGQPDHVAVAPDGVVFTDGSVRHSYDLLLRTCDGKMPVPVRQRVDE